MIDVSKCKKLVVENENNKLYQKEFHHIHFAPPSELVLVNGMWLPPFTRLQYENIVYVIHYNNENIFVKLDDITRIKFKDIGDGWTMRCSGIRSYFWKVDFMKKYPVTTNETEMAIYSYIRIEN